MQKPGYFLCRNRLTEQIAVQNMTLVFTLSYRRIRSGVLGSFRNRIFFENFALQFPEK
jgi:hypothetical protein